MEELPFKVCEDIDTLEQELPERKIFRGEFLFTAVAAEFSGADSAAGLAGICRLELIHKLFDVVSTKYSKISLEHRLFTDTLQVSDPAKGDAVNASVCSGAPRVFSGLTTAVSAVKSPGGRTT